MLVPFFFSLIKLTHVCLRYLIRQNNHNFVHNSTSEYFPIYLNVSSFNVNHSVLCDFNITRSCLWLPKCYSVSSLAAYFTLSGVCIVWEEQVNILLLLLFFFLASSVMSDGLLKKSKFYCFHNASKWRLLVSTTALNSTSLPQEDAVT